MSTTDCFCHKKVSGHDTMTSAFLLRSSARMRSADGTNIQWHYEQFVTIRNFKLSTGSKMLRHNYSKIVLIIEWQVGGFHFLTIFTRIPGEMIQFDEPPAAPEALASQGIEVVISGCLTWGCVGGDFPVISYCLECQLQHFRNFKL